MPALLSPLILLASCGAAATGDSAASRETAPVTTSATGSAAGTAGGNAGGNAGATDGAPISFTRTELSRFDEPWAAAFAPGTGTLFVTEKRGTVRWFDPRTRRGGAVTGAPRVDYGGQGGLGDIAFLPAESAGTVRRRTLYLSWAEAGPNGTRGAAVGRGTLACDAAMACRIEGMSVIWRQSPKVTGRGHYSHRLAISPDGRHLFVASGDRQKMAPAQDTANNLGSIVRLNLDGTPAAGNPFAGQAGKAADIWSWGHRNTLGLGFDAAGQLWNLEHGPRGGDELNRIVAGRNYGWPVVSDGDHYDGAAIPRHATRRDFAAPAISWNPVIAPGDFLFHSGRLAPALKGQAIIANLGEENLVRVRVDGERATELARHPMGFRVREIVEAPDGALLIFEDGGNGRLVRLVPRQGAGGGTR